MVDPRGQQHRRCQKPGGIDFQADMVTEECWYARPLFHMRRSSFGNGKVRPGFSDPAAPVCFFSSALGLYVPSMLLFFLMTHSSSSRVKLSTDSTVEMNAVTVGGDNICSAIVTESCGRKGTQAIRGVSKCVTPDQQ